jgi:hypothetical protein
MRLLPMRPAMWRGTLAGRGHLVPYTSVEGVGPDAGRTLGLWLSGLRFTVGVATRKDTWLLNTPGVKGFERC